MKTLGTITLILTLTAVVMPSFAQRTVIPSPQELQAKGIKPLSSEELQVLLTNNTLYHVVPKNGFRVPLLYLADGTRMVRLKGEVIKSSWRIERNMVCEYSVFLKKDVCRSLYKSDDVNAVCDEGASTCDYGWDWSAGNPERLGQ